MSGGFKCIYPHSPNPWWRHQMETFPRNWPFVRDIHRSPVNSPHKDQWRGASMFSLICAWINSWVNNREAGDLRCHLAHYDVIVMRFTAPGTTAWLPVTAILLLLISGVYAPVNWVILPQITVSIFSPADTWHNEGFLSIMHLWKTSVEFE